MYAICSNTSKGYRSKQGFTIVELLIVVVVIAILAAITIVAYNGITKNANNSSLQSTLSQALSKIELFKTDSPTGSYPLSLTAAGLNLVNNNGTLYVYSVSSDASQYCLATSNSGRTYFISDTSAKPQKGVCSYNTGTAGTGDVATDGLSTARFSLFGNTAPGTTQTIYTDGSGSLRVGNRFYTTEPGGIKVTGLRVYNPANSTAGFLSLNLTAYAYLNDWVGSSLNGTSTFSTGPVATKAYSTARLAGKWTDIYFTSPITLPAITSSASGSDLVTLAVQYSDGISYTYVTPIYPSYFESILRTKTYLGENGNLGQGINTDGPGSAANSYYGIDIIFELP